MDGVASTLQRVCGPLCLSALCGGGDDALTCIALCAEAVEEDEDEEDDAAAPKIGFKEPEPEDEAEELWKMDPKRWHPALGIRELPAVPQSMGARIGIDGNVEVLQVRLPTCFLVLCVSVCCARLCAVDLSCIASVAVVVVICCCHHQEALHCRVQSSKWNSFRAYSKGSTDCSQVLIKGYLEIGPYPIGQADHFDVRGDDCVCDVSVRIVTLLHPCDSRRSRRRAASRRTCWLPGTAPMST